jgi:hypothetical protein
MVYTNNIMHFQPKRFEDILKELPLDAKDHQIIQMSHEFELELIKNKHEFELELLKNDHGHEIDKLKTELVS